MMMIFRHGQKMECMVGPTWNFLNLLVLGGISDITYVLAQA